MMSIPQFLLMKIAEEASEVSQIALKTIQFGPNEKHPDLPDTNLGRLVKELTDLFVCIEEYEQFNNIEISDFAKDEWEGNKRAALRKYLKYSQELGMVEDGELLGLNRD